MFEKIIRFIGYIKLIFKFFRINILTKNILLLKMELRVGGKYRLSRKLGCGAFGDIYHGNSIIPK
jgi:hypothetical protein